VGSADSFLERGRDAFARRSWEEARDELAAAHEAGALDPPDLWRLALALHLTGDEERFVGALEEMHHAHLAADEPTAAARIAFWIGFHLANRGEMARASGWFGRAGRVLEPVDAACAERGYLMLPAALQQIGRGEYEACERTAREAAEIAARFGDADLLALALHMRGRALLRQGRVHDGLALLDEAMVAVLADELSPQVTGLVYCSVLSACREVWAVGRAQEWTRALTQWCERQRGMVTYTGECRVYRAEILRRRGAWVEALDEARDACARLSEERDRAVAGAAHYQRGEIHRVAGELDAAEEAYETASRLGRVPQPGLALLRLAQGEVGQAVASLRRSLAESSAAYRRAGLLPAYLEVLLAAGDVDEATRACDELAALADAWEASALDATVAVGRGAVALAAGEAREALPHLRRAWKAWQTLDAPYEAARTRVLLARACAALGDEDGARLERTAARVEFERLGAAGDVARLEADTAAPPSHSGRPDHGLTPREREVLAQLATGRTNRAIAEALFISEKTVARHVANLFGKLGVSSRAAATAWAYEHDLQHPPT
jgi:DNA-binding CsgD family transcriptional regulator